VAFAVGRPSLPALAAMSLARKTAAAARPSAARRLPGQRWRAPAKSDPTRVQHERMLQRNPSSKQAVQWCIEHGVLPLAEVERLWPLYMRSTGGAGQDRHGDAPSASGQKADARRTQDPRSWRISLETISETLDDENENMSLSDADADWPPEPEQCVAMRERGLWLSRAPRALRAFVPGRAARRHTCAAGMCGVVCRPRALEAPVRVAHTAVGVSL